MSLCAVDARLKNEARHMTKY